MRVVTIVQEVLAQYRVEFYERLRHQLASHDVELRLLYGRATGDRAKRSDEASLHWATPIRNRTIGLGEGPKAVWQSAVRHIRGSDLVIVEHANRQLLNYPLLAASISSTGPRVAFWGHGANLQARNHNSIAERFKRRTATLPHWWFAYTEGSAARVAKTGFPSNRITVVQNAIDTSAYAEVNLPKESHLCIFLGSLHKHKRIDFLMESSQLASRQLTDFHLVVAGDGEDRAVVERWAKSSSWLTFEGALFGRSKVDAVTRASLMLMPGLVGLAVTDSFAAATPLITTNHGWHSPEFEYILDGYNGIVGPTDCSPREYADLVVTSLTSQATLRGLQQGCRESAAVITLEAMVDRFADGVLEALQY